MKTKKTFLFCLAISLGLLGMSRTLQAFTVDEAVTEALTHRPDLDKLRATVGAASWKRLETLSGHLPRLSASANHFMDNKYVMTPFELGGTAYEMPNLYPFTDVSLDVSLNVFDGLKTVRKYQASRLQHQASEKDLARLVFQTTQEVRLKFFQTLAAKEMADVAAQNISTLTEHLKVVRLRIQNGLSTKVDLLQVETRLEEAKAEQMAADDNVVLTRRELSRAMGLQNDLRPLDGSLPVPQEASAPANIPFDPSKRDDLAAKNILSQAARKDAAAAASFWVPSATVFAQKQFYNNLDETLQRSSFNDAYLVGLSLNWDLFDGGASIAKQVEASYHADEAKATAQDALLKGPNELEFWKRRFLYSCHLYQAKMLNITRAEESVRLVKLEYRNGTKNNSEVLDVVLEWTQAKAGSIQAQVNALDAFQNLELASGRPFQTQATSNPAPKP